MELIIEDDDGKIIGHTIQSFYGDHDKLKVVYPGGKVEWFNPKIGTDYKIFNGSRIEYELVGPLWQELTEAGKREYYEEVMKTKARYRKGGRFFDTKKYSEWKTKWDIKRKTKPGNPRESEPKPGGKSAVRN